MNVFDLEPNQISPFHFPLCFRIETFIIHPLYLPVQMMVDTQEMVT